MAPACLDSNGGPSVKQNSKSISANQKTSGSDKGSFDCNICLESPHDPVVTLCGHLYCWPCIYRWLQVQSSSDESNQPPSCPICKANISHASLIPLYGRGTSRPDSEAKNPQMDLRVPRRPPPYISNASTSHPGQQVHSNFHHQQYFPHLHGGYPAVGSRYHGGAAMSSLFTPMIGMFGDMVFTRIFRSSGANLFSYPHVISYLHNGNGNPRMRRQEMQIDKSLNRVCFFLLCCIILCLLLF